MPAHNTETSRIVKLRVVSAMRARGARIFIHPLHFVSTAGLIQHYLAKRKKSTLDYRISELRDPNNDDGQFRISE